jgi:hypothetical protein
MLSDHEVKRPVIDTRLSLALCCRFCPVLLLLQEFLLPPIAQLLGLEASSAKQPGSSTAGSSAFALPSGAGGLMMQAWNLPGMLAGGGFGSRGSQNPGSSGSGRQAGGQGSSQQQQGHAAAAVDDAISRAQQLRDQLYGQQLMQGFDPQELRMVSEGGGGGRGRGGG